MDLGIQVREAIVFASSRGLGRHARRRWRGRAYSVVINGVDPERLERAATAMREATGAYQGLL